MDTYEVSYGSETKDGGTTYIKAIKTKDGCSVEKMNYWESLKSKDQRFDLTILNPDYNNDFSSMGGPTQRDIEKRVNEMRDHQLKRIEFYLTLERNTHSDQRVQAIEQYR